MPTKTTKTAKQAALTAQVEQIVRTMDIDHYTRLRRAYYKAVEGLAALQEELEHGPGDGPMIAAHLEVCEIRDLFDHGPNLHAFGQNL